MAWEDRKGRSYYYRAERIGGPVRKTYLGSGEMARMAARTDAAMRRTKELERERERAERERLKALAAPVEELCEAAEVLTEAHLLAAGFTQHKG